VGQGLKTHRIGGREYALARRSGGITGFGVPKMHLGKLAQLSDDLPLRLPILLLGGKGRDQADPHWVKASTTRSQVIIEFLDEVMPASPMPPSRRLVVIELSMASAMARGWGAHNIAGSPAFTTTSVSPNRCM